MKRTPRIISIDTTGTVRAVEDSEKRQARERLAALAWLLDSSLPIPGTRLTVGLDAVIGLLPVVGDLVGVLLSSYIIGEAARLGAPRLLLLRMAFNVSLEGVIGSIPVFGDAFDAAWKTNQRNVRLLGDWLEHGARTERSSRVFGLTLLLAIAAILTGAGIGAFLLMRWIIGLA